MNKVTEMLEKNVEWIAIGLGAIFMLFMVYSYVLSPVAEVDLSSENKLGPGEIDVYTHDHVGKQLESAMQENTRLPTTVPSYTKTFNDTMSWATAPVVVLDNVWPNLTKDPEVPPPPAVAGGAPNNAANAVPNPAAPNAVAPAAAPPAANQKVAALPVPPPAAPAESKFGRSVVLIPDANGQIPPPPANGQPVVGGVDKDWVTQMFKINLAELDKEFRAKSIPLPPPGQEAFKTTFLQIEMVREELDDNGQAIPGTERPVQPLGVYRNQGTPPPPFPAPGATKEEESTYLSWAMQNSGDVLQPLFYPTAKGDQWTKPGEQITPVAVFDPATFTGEVNALPPDQKKAVMDYRREQQRLKAEQPKQSRPAAPRPSGGGRGAPPELDGGRGANYAVAPPPARPPARPTARPPAYPRNGLPPEMEGPGLEGGYGGYGGGGGGPTPAGLPQPGVDYPGNGKEFAPSEAPWNNKTIECWMHDADVLPNRTYHYKLRYKLKNPIWAAANVAVNPLLADQFVVESTWSSWSSPVTIPALVNFFVFSTPSPNSTTCRFDVFKWENGAPKNETFNAGAGDEVGGTKNGINFSTGWIVVDFRDEPRSGERQIILVNDQGRLITRSYGADRNDPLYKGLKDQIAAQKATETAAAPGGAAPIVGGK